MWGNQTVLLKMVQIALKTSEKQQKSLLLPWCWRGRESVSFLITKDYHNSQFSIIIMGDLTLCFSWWLYWFPPVQTLCCSATQVGIDVQYIVLLPPCQQQKVSVSCYDKDIFFNLWHIFSRYMPNSFIWMKISLYDKPLYVVISQNLSWYYTNLMYVVCIKGLVINPNEH